VLVFPVPHPDDQPETEEAILLFVLKVEISLLTVSTALTGEIEEISKQTAINLGGIMQVWDPGNFQNERVCFGINLPQILP
jgi:hypothetical protein